MLTSINKNYSHVIKCNAKITCRNYMLSNGILCVIEDNIYSILYNYDFSIQSLNFVSEKHLPVIPISDYGTNPMWEHYHIYFMGEIEISCDKDLYFKLKLKL